MTVKTMGDRIRQARDRAGLTQAQVALKFAIDRVSVAQWETGATSPQADKLPALAKMLNVSADWLLTGQQYENTLEGITKRYKDEGGAAFPCTLPGGLSFAGMTLQQWYAGQALPSIIDIYGINPETVAETAHLMAKLMIAKDPSNEPKAPITSPIHAGEERAIKALKGLLKLIDYWDFGADKELSEITEARKVIDDYEMPF